MDLSSEYIKMCDCPEIQNMYGTAYPDGDPNGEKNYYYDSLKGQSDYPGSPEVVWLPKQDQLQAMVGNDTNSILKAEGRFHYFIRLGYPSKLPTVQSMEQLWLHFVMWDRFHKYYYEKGWAFKDAGES